MFRARLPSIFNTCHKCHTCHGICTLSPLDAALPMRFAKKHSTRHVQSAVPATKAATHRLKTSQKYCACHTKRLSTRYKTRLNDTKCHACHAKRSNETLETSKPDHLCRTSHRHGIRGSYERLRTVANGCGHKRNVERTHPQPPDPQSETGTLATHSGKCAI